LRWIFACGRSDVILMFPLSRIRKLQRISTASDCERKNTFPDMHPTALKTSVRNTQSQPAAVMVILFRNTLQLQSPCAALAIQRSNFRELSRERLRLCPTGRRGLEELLEAMIFATAAKSQGLDSCFSFVSAKATILPPRHSCHSWLSLRAAPRVFVGRFS
jgi:hypothetical protein